jgi:GxxExxY protein
MDGRFPHQELSAKVIGAFYEVYNTLGYGYLESVYKRALAVELSYLGLPIQQEVGFEVSHRGVPVGTYRADIIVSSSLIVEAKAGAHLDPNAAAQILNYLKTSRLRVGLVLHFGPKPVIKRVVL